MIRYINGCLSGNMECTAVIGWRDWKERLEGRRMIASLQYSIVIKKRNCGPTQQEKEVDLGSNLPFVIPGYSKVSTINVGWFKCPLVYVCA
jgi:hypothetical protein